MAMLALVVASRYRLVLPGLTQLDFDFPAEAKGEQI
jgi:hypothetical protein